MQKENSFFFCIPEREYLRAIGSKLRLSERKTKENTFSFVFPNVSNLEASSLKGTIKWAEYKRKNSVFFCIPEREYLRAAGSKLLSSYPTMKGHTDIL